MWGCSSSLLQWEDHGVRFACIKHHALRGAWREDFSPCPSIRQTNTGIGNPTLSGQTIKLENLAKSLVAILLMTFVLIKEAPNLTPLSHCEKPDNFFLEFGRHNTRTLVL